MSPTPRGWLTRKEVAELVGVHPRTVKRWADEGRIAFVRLPGGATRAGHRRYPRTAVEQILREEGKAMDKVEVYKDQAGEWRWRRKAPNGQIIATSGEGYTDKSGAAYAAGRANADGQHEVEILEGTD